MASEIEEFLCPHLVNDMVVGAMYVGAYLGAPGLIAEFIVRERNDKLRNVLTVMGCDFRAYWIGTFIADYIIMAIPMVVMWICWFAAGGVDFLHSLHGLVTHPQYVQKYCHHYRCRADDHFRGIYAVFDFVGVGKNIFGVVCAGLNRGPHLGLRLVIIWNTDK